MEIAEGLRYRLNARVGQRFPGDQSIAADEGKYVQVLQYNPRLNLVTVMDAHDSRSCFHVSVNCLDPLA